MNSNNNNNNNNPISILENKMHKYLWDFEIQIDHLILTRRPDLVIANDNDNKNNKKKKKAPPPKKNKKTKKQTNLPNRVFCRPGRAQGKIKIKRKGR